MRSGLNLFKISVIASSYFWIFIFVICPLLITLGISLSWEEFGRMPFKFFIGMDTGKLSIAPNFSSFSNILSEPIYYESFLTSLRLAFLSTFFCLLLGYPIAYSIFNLPREYRSLLLLLIMIPFWTSMLIRIYAWMVVLRNNGVINYILLKLSIIDAPLEMLNTEFAVIIGIVYTYLPFMILPIYSSLEKVNISLLEVAQDLGCKPFKVFWSVTFPLSLSGVLIGSFLVFIPALGEYVIPELLGGASIVTIGKIVWTEFFISRDWIAASAISVILSLLIVVPVGFIRKFIDRRVV